jgi:hypothetical protein
MRALAVLLTLAGFMLPAYGARRVTVDRLKQTLAGAHSLPDAEVARQLSDLELTERLSRAKLKGLETDLPGEKSRLALMILADTSAFLDLPAAEILAQPAPAAAYQPIHLVGDSNVTVIFRDGHEVLEKSNFDPRVRPLTTAGVFGPILGTVVVDAARSKLV